MCEYIIVVLSGLGGRTEEASSGCIDQRFYCYYFYILTSAYEIRNTKYIDCETGVQYSIFGF